MGLEGPPTVESTRGSLVVLDGQASYQVPVLSCVPQGLFLIFISELPQVRRRLYPVYEYTFTLGLFDLAKKTLPA